MMTPFSFFHHTPDITVATGIGLVLFISSTTLSQTQEIDALKKKAEQGDVEAQFNLGVLYVTGKRVPQDYEEAVKWFQKAAEQGEAAAQSNLGMMYHRGDGVPQDYEEAVKWYRKAAEQGFAAGQFKLGAMYTAGLGAPKDYVQAHMWLTLAAANNFAEEKETIHYAEWRDKLAALMTPEQIAEAQKLAREWVAAHSKGQ